MSKGWKIALIMLGCLLLLGLGTCGACYFWLASNKDELLRQGNAAKQQGIDFAAAHTDEDCIGSAMARLDGCASKGPVDTTMCRAMTNVYLESCMQNAKQTEAVCQGVPKVTELLEFAKWAVNACAARSRAGDEACGQMMQAVGRVCHRRLTAKAR